MWDPQFSHLENGHLTIHHTLKFTDSWVSKDILQAQMPHSRGSVSQVFVAFSPVFKKSSKAVGNKVVREPRKVLRDSVHTPWTYMFLEGATLR